MASKHPKMRKCIYSDCTIPDNNNCYFWQLGFLVFGVLGFFLKSNEFSFFNVFLFLFPILLDLIYNDMKDALLWFKRIYIFVDVVCMIACFVGFTMLRENGLNVSVDALYVGELNLSIIKNIMFVVLLSNIPVPVIFYYGRPCKKNMEIVRKILNFEKNLQEEREAC